MSKRFTIPAIMLALAMLLCACAETPPASSEPSSASSESAESSVTLAPTPMEAVSPPPEPTATPVPTKKPTVKATPTLALQNSVPEYLQTYSFGSIEALREFILTADVATFQKGHYASMVSRAKNNGYFVKPIFTDEILFSTVSGVQIACAVSECETVGSGVAYRVSYGNNDIFMRILDVTQDKINEVKENLYAFELAVDKRKDGFDKDAAIAAGYKQTTFTVGSSVRDTWGRITYGQGGRVDYRIWFLLDDRHLVSVDWFGTNVELAEEFVSKLEFEKVEFAPMTEAPKTTPEVEK